MPRLFRASMVPRPNVAFDNAVPCISSPASSRTDVQPHTRARLSSHGFSAATPPTARPCDQSQTRASSWPWRSAVVKTRSSVLSLTLTAAAAGTNAARAAARRIGDDRPARPQIGRRLDRADAADLVDQQLANVLTLVVADPRSGK